MKIKVYYEHRSQNNDGYYGEDNPSADYPNEVYYPSTWSTHIDIVGMEFKDVQKAFDQEDSDDYFTRSILFITDADNKVIFNPGKFKHAIDYKHAWERLLERAKYEQDEVVEGH